MPVQMNQDTSIGNIGAIKFGPNLEFKYGSYRQFWAEAEALPEHKAKLALLKEEAEDSKPSLAARNQQAYEHYDTFVKALEAAIPEACEMYDAAEKMGSTVLDFYNKEKGYHPHSGHVVARSGSGRKKSG